MTLAWRRWSFYEFTSRRQCFCFTGLLIGMLEMFSSFTVESFLIGLESCFALVGLGNGFSDASSALLAVLRASLRFPVALDIAALVAGLGVAVLLEVALVDAHASQRSGPRGCGLSRLLVGCIGQSDSFRIWT